MTVADLISGALQVMGVLASGESPTAAEQTDAFNALNRMLDTWANQRLALYASLRSSYALTPGLNPHTIGPGGTFSTTRPIAVDRASVVFAASANSELPLDILTDGEWQITQGKATTGTPSGLWVEASHPLMKLWLNPIPVAADTLVLYTPAPLGRFASTSTTFDMPAGYEEAIIYQLAKRLCPQFGVQLSAEAADIANESFSALKRTNTQTSYLRSDEAIVGSGGFNIISGDR